MKNSSPKPVRCAIYTRVSTDQGLDQDYNSLDAQCDASQAYIRSQAHAGWTQIRTRYDDGGYSGGNTDRPALKRLLEDVKADKVDVIVVYKASHSVKWPHDLHCKARSLQVFSPAGEAPAIGVLYPVMTCS